MIKSINGFFNVDKPIGLTSTEVVRRIKRSSSQKRVGHAGTLNPAATGVLPICVGQGTRLTQFIVNSHKKYVGTVHLGVSTDTYDGEGKVTAKSDPSNVTLKTIESALGNLRAETHQTPPPFSALKLQGKRLYELARRGEKITVPPRRVDLIKLEIMEWASPELTIFVQCKQGFYVRSLAQDLGEKLGCGAHLSKLHRLKTGPFHIENAMSLDAIQDSLAKNTWEDLIIPPDYVVLDMPSIKMDKEEEQLIRHGQAIRVKTEANLSDHLQKARAYGQGNKFTALVKFDLPTRSWLPFRVFSLDTNSPYSDHNRLNSKSHYR